MASEASGDTDADSRLSYDSEGLDHDGSLHWQGPASTWRAYNAQELSDAAALETIRDRDLSLHLYNTYALHHRHKTMGVLRIAPEPVPEEDTDAETSRPIQTDSWEPPRWWATWPLSPSRVPPSDFQRRTPELEASPRLTLCMGRAEGLHIAMQDAIAAKVLGLAKEHFLSRHFNNVGSYDDDSLDDPQTALAENASEHVQSDAVELGRAKEDIFSRIKPGHTSKELIPLVSADDDLSRQVLGPPIQHMMGKIDATLTTLHNAQEAAASYLSEGSDSDSGHSARSRQRSTSREHHVAGKHNVTLSSEFVREFVAQWDPDANPLGDASQEPIKRGRPKKKYPRLPAEGDTDYVLRVSRMRKMKVSAQAVVRNNEHNTTRGSVIDVEDTSNIPPRPRAQFFSERKRRQLRPRDWTDVLNAASLAGFSPQVLDRVARRCADLFGQQTRIHSLDETRHDQETWLYTQAFMAGMPVPDVIVGQLPEDRAGSKQRARDISTRLGGASLEPDVEQACSRGRATSRGRSLSTRSRSASTNIGSVFPCRVLECPRSSNPFPRRSNMVRHMKQVHNLKIDMDVDSEDEMHGAVHVDGYMKPVRIRSGWRRGTHGTSTGDLAEQRKRKRGRRMRPDDEESP